MKLQTPVIDEKCKVGISYDDRIMMLGSCFSDNIGRRLSDYGFDVCVNPFGTLYNPASITESVRRLISGRHFTEEDCTEIGAGSDKICSFHHHTSFSAGTKEDFLKKANDALDKASEFFRRCNKVIITLGTSWCYRHIGKNMIVSNCLKHPASEFSRELLPVELIGTYLEGMTEACRDKEFIFTVSPIRHFRDGAHGNQLSKSALLLAVDNLISSGKAKADYFPAYEIVMDELRDYRFYAEDMCHPSSQAADYICRRFLDWALPADEHPVLEENIRQYKRNSHKENL